MEEDSCKAELVDVVRESQLWGEHYNRKFTIPYALTLVFKALCGVLDCHNDSKKDTGV